MNEAVVVINLPEVIEEIKFRKAIEALGTYQSEDEYLDAMIAITERDMAEDPNFPKQICRSLSKEEGCPAKILAEQPSLFPSLTHSEK